ncbi:MAG: DNA alkylation repair protein [Ruminococcus sp.]|nr:DNA alkylation repair protein [Ruminococcus sp.]
MKLTRESWSQSDYSEFVEYLKTLADEKYKEFGDRIAPGTDFSIGIRIPVLRQLSKDIAKGNYAEFISCKIGAYREEIMLKGLVMALVKCDFPQMLAYIKTYADMIVSWETNDIVSFKGLKKYLPEMWREMDYFIFSKNPWVVRYGFKMLMDFYLTDEYIDGVLKYVNSVNSEFYYVQMMQAWLIATAAAKQRDKTFTFLASNDLNAKTQNMAIQKIRDSFRISAEDKETAKNLKKPLDNPKNA